MAITFNCPSCGYCLRAKDHLAGRRVRCRRCGQLLPVVGAQVHWIRRASLGLVGAIVLAAVIGYARHRLSERATEVAAEAPVLQHNRQEPRPQQGPTRAASSRTRAE